jgi:hypothetical protein
MLAPCSCCGVGDYGPNNTNLLTEERERNKKLCEGVPSIK